MSDEIPATRTSPNPEVVGPPLSPETKRPEPPAREPVRAILAVTLLAIFAAEVLIGFLFCLFGDEPHAERIQTIKELAQIFLGPTVALVGAATGFYFGRSGP